MSNEHRQLAASVPPLFHILGNAPVRGSREEPQPHQEGSKALSWVAALLILLAGAALPVWLALRTPVLPQTHAVHIEAYRYGFSPARIHVNRGDRVKLSFSTRDTGQSFFLQDYDLHVSITPGDRFVLVQRLSRPDDPPERREIVEFVAGLPGWQGWLFPKSTFRNHTYNGPLHGTERGDLIVGPNLLLYASLGLLCTIPFVALILGRRRTGSVLGRRVNLFTAFPWLKRVMRAPSFQFNLIVPMLAVFWFIILTGLLGTKVAGRNAAPMMIWVLWLSALIVVLVPIGGRIWCTACPLPAIGEWWQRARSAGNPALLDGTGHVSIFGFPLVWPDWLRNPWPRVLLFLLLGTFSTTLVVLPPATSWMLIVLVITAVLLSFFPEQRLFCRYMCPINSYISLYSTTGRVMVRAVASEPCEKCKEKFCLTGSAKGYGCPYGLCVGEVDRNNDCGACMECAKTCAYDNVAVFWRNSGCDTAVAGYGEAWQAMVMFALACLYCFINLGPWDWIRDWTDIVEKKNWDTFLIYAIVVWITCLGVLPLVWYVLTRSGIALARMKVDPKEQFRSTTAAFIPIGLACWIAFALATFLSMLTFVLQSLSDPFNWGWNLFGMAGSRWHIPLSPAIPALQVSCVLVGLAFSMGTLRRCWTMAGTTERAGLAAALPSAAFLLLAEGGMVWFFAA